MRRPLPSPPLLTLAGRFQARADLLRLALYGSAILNVGLCALLTLSFLQLRTREVVYVTTTGIQPAGFVSPIIAREFATDYVRWLHTFTFTNVSERNDYLIKLLCPAIQNAYLVLLESEAQQIQRTRVNQSIDLRGIDLVEAQGSRFRFRYRINRQSTLLNTVSSADEAYEITILHAPAPDGTRRLCVQGYKRVNL